MIVLFKAHSGHDSDKSVDNRQHVDGGGGATIGWQHRPFCVVKLSAFGALPACVQVVSRANRHSVTTIARLLVYAVGPLSLHKIGATRIEYREY